MRFRLLEYPSLLRAIVCFLPETKTLVMIIRQELSLGSRDLSGCYAFGITLEKGSLGYLVYVTIYTGLGY